MDRKESDMTEQLKWLTDWLNLTEVEDIKKRWQEYKEELCETYHNDPDNHNGMITYLEPDILEYEVKWALGSKMIKLVEVMEFQMSYFNS